MMSLAAALPRDEIRVTTHWTVDTRRLETIVRDVIRLADAKTDDEKGIAIYTWQNPAILHCACCPVKKAPRSVGPLKTINVRGGGLSGGPARVLKALFEIARSRGWSDPLTSWKVYFHSHSFPTRCSGQSGSGDDSGRGEP